MDILSEQYQVRVRDVIEPIESFGEWKELTVFNVVPRIYPDHPIYGDDGTFSKTSNKITSFVHFEIPNLIEVEVTKLFGSKASRVEIAPKAFNINPHYFDGNTVRFLLPGWSYLSVNFVCPENIEANLGHIRYGMVILADKPEASMPYQRPKPDDPGVVTWDNDLDIETIRDAEVIFFPPGDHKMKLHKDNIDTFMTDSVAMLAEPLYHGQLRLKKPQKIYISGGAYVRGCFKTNGHDGCQLYGRGIISGRDHLQHEVLIPKPDGQGGWSIETETKEAFVDFLGTEQAYIGGVVIMEPFHHSLPGAGNSTIEHIKIFGMGGNHDGIRTGNGTLADGLFIKTWDDYDYAYAPHTVKNSVFWPGSNGATHMIAWGNYGQGGATYKNNYIINAEWENPKNNSGVLGSNATEGIEHSDVSFENYTLENRTSYLVNVIIKPTGGGGNTYLKSYSFKNIKVEYPFQTSQQESMKQRMIGLNDQGNIGYLEGWTFTNLVVDGKLVTWDNYKEYFDLKLEGSNGSNLDEAKSVKDVTFSSTGQIYSIFVSSSEGGHFYPQGNQGEIDCPENTNQSVCIIPDSGYKITDVVVDDESLGRQQSVVFDNITDDHSVHIVFEQGEDYFDIPVFKSIDNIQVKSKKMDLKIFHNPTEELIRIETLNNLSKSLRIYDIQGHLVYSTTYKGNTISIDTSSYNPGIYICKITSQHDIFTRQFIVR